jgi:hypothetical protein
MKTIIYENSICSNGGGEYIKIKDESGKVIYSKGYGQSDTYSRSKDLKFRNLVKSIPLDKSGTTPRYYKGEYTGEEV